MKQSSLQTRFLISGFLLLAAVVCCGAWSLFTIDRFGSALGDTLDSHQQTIDLAVDMILSLEREDDILLLAINENAATAKDQLRQQRQAFDDAYRRLESRLETAQDRQAYQAIRTHVDEYRNVGDQVIAITDRSKAFESYYRLLNPALHKAVADCRYFRETNVVAMQQEGVQARADARRSTYWVGGILLTAAIGALVVLAGLTRRVMQPVRELDRAVEAIRHDDFDTRVGVRSNDELGRLAAGFNRMAEALAEYRRLTEARFRQLADNIHEIFWLTDIQQTKVFYISPGYEDVWGRTCQSLFEQPRSWIDGIHPEDRRRTVENSVARVQGIFQDIEYRVQRPDGAIRWVRSRAFPLHGTDGKPARIAGLAEDITERKRIEADIVAAKELAESANRSKDDFLANVSHEIRTPMNAILGMTNLVLDTSLGDDQRQCLMTVRSAAENLLGIINDLLDFSKMEAGKLELDPTEFSLRKLVKETVQALAVRAHSKGLELISQTDEQVPDMLIGDVGRVRQILVNLLGNAIKFTEHGEVELQISIAALEQSDQQKVRLAFQVRDTGIGIPRDKQEVIFRAFEQEDTSTTRRFGGTGLGLSIASQLTEMMDGKITVQSARGEGSVFTFSAPFEISASLATPTDRLSPALLNGAAVLIVDDNQTNRLILLEWLRGWNMDVTAIGDASEALSALILAAATAKPYSLVLLDARMPGMDGIELANLIRQKLQGPAPRLILLTSSDRMLSSAQERALKIDAYMLKPVQQAELYDKICEVMSRGQLENAAEAVETKEQFPEPAPKTGPTLRILLAEDDEFSARYMERLLRSAGHYLTLVKDGRAALRIAIEQSFDLLLLDVHMPELDGFQVMRLLREHERETGKRLRVVALTARSRKEDRQKCFDAGMDDFVTKPVTAADLLAAIQRNMVQEDVTPSQDAKPQQASTSSLGFEQVGLELLDPAALLGACGHDPEGLQRIVADFRTYAPIQFSKLQAAFAAADASSLQKSAHQFSPLLYAFSTQVGNVVSSIEDLASSSDLEKCRPLLVRLDKLIQSILPALAGLTLQVLISMLKETEHHRIYSG